MPMSDQKISVIVCTYNREKPLCNFLATLLAQSISNFDIILVDQTATHTPETTEFLQKHSDRIRVVRQETPNLPMARNTGLREVKSGYVVFADDDFLLPANCIGDVVSTIHGSDYAGVASIINWSLPIDAIWKECLKIHGYSLDRSISDGPLDVDVFGGLMAFRRELFDKVGYFDENFGILNRSCSGEDTEFCRRVRTAGLKLCIDPRIIVEHELEHSGGCAAREGDSQKILRQQLRANLYIEMKYSRNPPRIDTSGWLRLCRALILNRAILTSKCREIPGRISLLRKEFQDVQRVFLETRNRP